MPEDKNNYEVIEDFGDGTILYYDRAGSAIWVEIDGQLHGAELLVLLDFLVNPT